MSFFKKIKELLNKSQSSRVVDKKDYDAGEREYSQSSIKDASEAETQTELTKFDAEYYSPRLSCFYCNRAIKDGKLRFMDVPGFANQPFHKPCFKKLKRGKVPSHFRK